MTEQTHSAVATRLAAALAERGSDIAFGVPGGGPNLDVVGALAASDIRFVLAHGETAACIMASVYGYLTGRVAPTIVTRGPGAASAVNGAAQATLDRHPLVLVTDTVPAAHAVRVPHQRIDQRALFEPVTKVSATLDESLADEAVAALLDLAQRAPAGAIHLDFDTSPRASDAALGAPVDGSDESERFEPADGQTLGNIMAMIAAAEHPVVIAGIGATGSETVTDQLIAFGAPTLTTYQAIGVVPTEHDCAAGLFTNGASERPLLDEADLIIAVGLDVVEPIPAGWTYSAPVVSLTDSPTTDPYLPIAAEMVGDLAAMTAQLPTGKHRWPIDAGLRHRKAVRTALADGVEAAAADTVTPLELVSTVSAHLPSGALTTVDAGAHFLAIMPFWPATASKQVLISNGLATMGYAVPAAIGAALASPGSPVACLVGDGGLGMTLAELETIVRLDLPVTVIVFNDSALSLIRIKQAANHGGAEAVSYLPSDFAVVAGGLGMSAVRVTSTAELAAELTAGWDGPRLIDVAVDPTCYRHLIEVTRG